MKHYFYFLLTSGSNMPGDKAHSMNCSAPLCSRAAVQLSHHTLSSPHTELGQPVKRIQENLDYFRRVNSKLQQPTQTMSQVCAH